MIPYLREQFKDLSPYHSAYITDGIILNANESPYEAPEELVTYMQEKVRSLLVNRYPDTDSIELATSIAKAYGIEVTNVTCGVGSDELIDCILAAVLDVEDKVIMPYPSFSMYGQFTKLNSGSLIKVPLNKDFGYDLEALKKSIVENNPKIVFLCNPNNPTGCILKSTEVREILEISKGIVIVDEAYAEFCEEDISMIDYINDYSNLIVLKTFSKAYGLAGARIGYGIACTQLIDLINTVKPPYNVNIFSQEIATWAMKNRDVFIKRARKIVEDRKELQKGLEILEIKTYNTHSNFIWLELPEGIFEKLNERKIYIRKMAVDNKVYYRINSGTQEENVILLETLREIL